MRGFGGIGGILRWKLDFLALADDEVIESVKATRAAANAASAMEAAGLGGGSGGLDEGDDDDDVSDCLSHQLKQHYSVIALQRG